MQQVLLLDRTRVPPNWTDLIRPGQYAVFLSDIESSAPVSSDGFPVNSASEFFCLIFDSLTDAESYCQRAVSQTRNLKCEIFDSARRLVRWGFVAIAISLPLFWYAWRNNAGVVWWPVFLGINSVFAGLRLIQWGHGLKEELIYRQKEAALRLQQNATPQGSK